MLAQIDSLIAGFKGRSIIGRNQLRDICTALVVDPTLLKVCKRLLLEKTVWGIAPLVDAIQVGVLTETPELSKQLKEVQSKAVHNTFDFCTKNKLSAKSQAKVMATKSIGMKHLRFIVLRDHLAKQYG